jgi:hypothetical protein
MVAGAGLLAFFLLLHKCNYKSKRNNASDVTTRVPNAEFNVDKNDSSMQSSPALVWNNNNAIDSQPPVSNAVVPTDVPKPMYPVHPTLHVKDQCRAVVTVPPVVASMVSLAVSQGGDGKAIPFAVAVGVHGTSKETTTRSFSVPTDGDNPETPSNRLLSVA